MPRVLSILLLSCVLAVVGSVVGPSSAPGVARAQEEERAREAGKDAESAAQRRAELEERFAATLSGATMVGKWRLVVDGELRDEKEERYTLGRVTKLSGDTWIIQARIQYGNKDVTLPVPVKVLWAGDTPVIQVTNAGLPGLGKYTARVLVYDGLYTGTWSGPGYGGFLSGRIVPPAAEPSESAEESEQRDGEDAEEPGSES